MGRAALIWLFGEIWLWVLAGFGAGLLTGLWLRRTPTNRPGKLWPEAKWRVSLAAGSLHVSDAEGGVRGIALSAIGAVVIETNDSGPWGADFWWLLYNREGDLACAFPQGATGEADAVAHLETMPGYDREEMGRAIRSTHNARFTVWRDANAEPSVNAQGVC